MSQCARFSMVLLCMQFGCIQHNHAIILQPQWLLYVSAAEFLPIHYYGESFYDQHFPINDDVPLDRRLRYVIGEMQWRPLRALPEFAQRHLQGRLVPVFEIDVTPQQRDQLYVILRQNDVMVIHRSTDDPFAKEIIRVSVPERSKSR